MITAVPSTLKICGYLGVLSLGVGLRAGTSKNTLNSTMAIQCIHLGLDTEVSEWFVVTSLSLPEIPSLFSNS